MPRPEPVPMHMMRAPTAWREVTVDEIVAEQDEPAGKADGLLDVHAVAERMGLSRRSLDRLISSLPADLRPLDVGQGRERARWRWRSEDLDVWITRVDAWQRRSETPTRPPKGPRPAIKKSDTRAVTNWRKELLGR